MIKKELHRQVMGLLEDYKLYQDSWHKDTREKIYRSLLIICERYKKVYLRKLKKRINKRLNTIPEEYRPDIVFEDINEKEIWLDLDKKSPASYDEFCVDDRIK